MGAGGEGDDRGWDSWMVSLTWVWVDSSSWWWTGRPGVLQSMGLQRVGHDWATELNWKKSLFIQILLEQNKKLIILIMWKLVLYIKKIFWKTDKPGKVKFLKMIFHVAIIKIEKLFLVRTFIVDGVRKRSNMYKLPLKQSWNIYWELFFKVPLAV